MEAEEAFRAVDFDKGNHNELGGMRRPVSVDRVQPSQNIDGNNVIADERGRPRDWEPPRTRALSSSSLYPQHLARNPAPSKRSGGGSSREGTDSGQTCPSGCVQGQVLGRQL